MVEDDRRRQRQAARRAEPVAQLDRGERVEAELLEGAVRIDPGRRVAPQDRRCVGADQLEHEAEPLALGHLRKALAERTALLPGRAAGTEQAPHWRRHRFGLAAQDGEVEAHRQHVGAIGGQGCVEEGQPLLVGERGNAGPLHSRLTGAAER